MTKAYLTRDIQLTLSIHSSSSQLSTTELEMLTKPVPRYTSYPPVPAWNHHITEPSVNTAISAIGDSGEACALYLHIPFCRSQCWYCGCNTVIRKSNTSADPYIDALVTEIELIAEASPKRISVNEIHWGGGTPNFLDSNQITTIITALNKHFDLLGDCAFSVECDPRTLTEDHLLTFSTQGAKRLSLGIQDFNAKVQKAINRIQPFEMVEQLTNSARKQGFESINFDLIVGLPHQTEASFFKTVQQAISLRPERIALFNFAYLPEQRKHMRLIKAETLPTSHTRLECVFIARTSLLEAGYVEIGLDHFALPNDELAMAAKNNSLYRNFMGFTPNTSPHVIGLGMSSISESSSDFWQNTKELDTYLQALSERRLPLSGGHKKSQDDQERAWIIQHLMCRLELNYAEFFSVFKTHPKEIFPEAFEKLQNEIPAHFYTEHEHGLKIHNDYKLYSRLIASCFDARSTASNPMSKSL